MLLSVFFMSHVVLLQDKTNVSNLWIPNVMFTLSTMVSQGSCSLFDFLWKVPVGWQKEIDCDINANHQGTLRRLMEILFSVEDAEVKRLVPQWEKRMWEWYSTTSLLGVSQTTKRHGALSFDAADLSFTEYHPRGSNHEWKCQVEFLLNFTTLNPLKPPSLNQLSSWYYLIQDAITFKPCLCSDCEIVDVKVHQFFFNFMFWSVNVWLDSIAGFQWPMMREAWRG